MTKRAYNKKPLPKNHSTFASYNTAYREYLITKYERNTMTEVKKFYTLKRKKDALERRLKSIKLV